VAIVVERLVAIAPLVHAAAGRWLLVLAVFAGEKAARERRPGKDADAVPRAKRLVLALEAARADVVLRLQRDVAREIALVGDPERLHETVRGVVRAPDVDDLARADCIVERAQELFLAGAEVLHVDLVEIDAVGAETREARVDRAQDPHARRTGTVGAFVHPE